MLFRSKTRYVLPKLLSRGCSCICGLAVCVQHFCPALHGQEFCNEQSRDDLAPYLGSQWESIRIMLEMADFKKGERLLDLGAGDGRVLIQAIKQGASKATGWELNEAVYRLGCAHLDGYLSPEERNCVDFVNGDALSCPVHDVDVITLFLLPKGCDLIGKHLKKELSEKACDQPIRIVSAGWPLPGWRQSEERVTSGGSTLYLYKTGSSSGLEQ